MLFDMGTSGRYRSVVRKIFYLLSDGLHSRFHLASFFVPVLTHRSVSSVLYLRLISNWSERTFVLPVTLEEDAPSNRLIYIVSILTIEVNPKRWYSHEVGCAESASISQSPHRSQHKQAQSGASL